MLLWFVFGVFGIVPEVLKCLFFPVLGAFVVWNSFFLQNFGDGKNEVFEKKIVFLFFLFYVGEVETEKRKKKKKRRKMEKGQKTL